MTICFLIAGSWFVVYGDLHWISDIARDFFLYGEIATKKLVLIGPRASGMPGMFHGPLWIYLNFPAYLLGKGNPAFVGLFWVALVVVYVGMTTALVKRVFNRRTGLMAGLFVAIQMVTFTRQLFNPYGATFLMPVLWFVLYRYLSTQKFIYLLLFGFVIGAIIQFQMAVGIPLAIVSAPLFLYIWYKHKKWPHVVALLAVVPFILPWLVFDYRHAGSLTQSLINYVVVKNPERVFFDLKTLLNMRASILFSKAFQVFPTDLDGLNTLVAALVAIVYFVKRPFLTSRTNRAILLLMYLYLGFFVVSMFHNGWLLVHYYLPLIPLALIFFAAVLIQSKSKLLWFVAVFVVMLNATIAWKGMKDTHYYVDNSVTSWRFYDRIAFDTLNRQSTDFGYFIYAPDVLGYQIKYAFAYNEKKLGKAFARNTKAPITYVMAESPPQNTPGLSVEWWLKNKLHIEAQPFAISRLANGYVLYEFHLTPEQISIPHDSDQNDWLYYR